MLVHLLFGTPFLIALALWAACFTLYVVLLELGFKERYAVAFRWARASGWQWPWWVAVVGMFVGAALANWTFVDGVTPADGTPNQTLSGAMTFISIMVILLPVQLACALHNRHALPLPPAGWFAMSDGSGHERYWDGAKWTPIVHDPSTGVVMRPNPGTIDMSSYEVPPHV